MGLSLLILLSATGCKLFGTIQEARDLLEDPISMQSVFVGLEPPEGIDLDGSALANGGMIQAWIQETSTNGVSTASGAVISLVSDRHGSVKLVQDGDTWIADGLDGLEYAAADEIKLVADYGGERHSIRMITPYPPIVDLPEEHTAGLGLTVDLRDQNFENAGVIVVNMFTGELVWQSDYDVTEPVDMDNLLIDIEGGVFLENNLYAVGVVGLSASEEGGLKDLVEVGSGMLTGTMVLSPVSTIQF